LPTRISQHAGDNLDECYADCQVLRSKCEAEVFVELVNTQTEQTMSLPGMEVQVGAGCMCVCVCVCVTQDTEGMELGRRQQADQAIPVLLCGSGGGGCGGADSPRKSNWCWLFFPCTPAAYDVCRAS